MATTIKKLRNRILEVALRDGMGHIPSALSILDIVWTLYDKVMTPDDQFILSKGHGVMALYAVLEEKGLMTWNDKLWGHPKRGGAILASTGSLGHGMPMAVGLALAKKIKGEQGRIFCLIGDGECNEGTIWESALIAAHHKLDNLVVIVDQNHSSDRALNLGILRAKFTAFDWFALGINGHAESTLVEVLDNYHYIPDVDEPINFHANHPLCIIADTIKGNGVPFMQDPSWHNRKLNESEYNEAIKLC
jgi:transketolase